MLRYTIFMFLLIHSGVGLAAADDTTQLRFRVLLDDNQIGYHTYDLRRSGQDLEVISEAEFKVRLLFITAFRYQHKNVEVWEGDCLAAIDSETNSNGKKTAVAGSRAGDQFVLYRNEDRANIVDCVSSFAYWDREFLNRARLLNPQTGQLVDVEVERLETQTLTVYGNPVDAVRYRLTGEKLRLDIWYSRSGDWLALESPAKGGRVIRYERVS